jgi:hypothetical protein
MAHLGLLVQFPAIIPNDIDDTFPTDPKSG